MNSRHNLLFANFKLSFPQLCKIVLLAGQWTGLRDDLEFFLDEELTVPHTVLLPSSGDEKYGTTAWFLRTAVLSHNGSLKSCNEAVAM